MSKAARSAREKAASISTWANTKIDKEDLDAAQWLELIAARTPWHSARSRRPTDDLELVRTMSVQPPRGAGDIRTVRVEGVDYQPCGNDRASLPTQIGAVHIGKIKRKGVQHRRVHLVLDWSLWRVSSSGQTFSTRATA